MDKRHIISTYNISPDQRGDVFYTPSHLAEVVWEVEGNDYVVLRNGEMRVDYFMLDKQEVETLTTTADFLRVGLDTDSKVSEADAENLLDWIYNPWFEVSLREADTGECEVFSDIVEAIERAITLGACKHEGTLALDTNTSTNCCTECHYNEPADPHDIAEQYRLLAENETNPTEQARLLGLANDYESRGN